MSDGVIDDGAAAAARPPRSVVGRLAPIALLVGFALTLGGGALTWFSADVPQQLVGAVSVSGFATVATLIPLLLVVAAGLLARALARGVVRLVLGWLTVLMALVLLSVVVAGLSRGRAAIEEAAATATGVPVLAGEVHQGLGPWLALVGALVLVVGTVLTALRRRGPARAAAYERTGRGRGDGVEAGRGGQAGAAVSHAPEPIADWDALSRGEDPTDTGTSG